MSQLQINSCGCLLQKILLYAIIYNEIEYVSEVFMNTDHLKYFVLVADSRIPCVTASRYIFWKTVPISDLFKNSWAIAIFLLPRFMPK